MEPTSATSPDTAAHGVGPTKLPVVTSESDAELTIDATSAGTEPQSLFEVRSNHWVMPVKPPSSVGILPVIEFWRKSMLLVTSVLSPSSGGNDPASPFVPNSNCTTSDTSPDEAHVSPYHVGASHGSPVIQLVLEVHELLLLPPALSYCMTRRETRRFTI